MNPLTGLLHAGFLRSVQRYPDRPALQLRGKTISYAEADLVARRWAAALLAAAPAPRRVGLFAHRSEVSYLGMLAALYAGAAVVPLNRTFPPARTRDMLERAELDVLLVDAQSAEQLPEVLRGLDPVLPVVAPESAAGRLDLPPGTPLLAGGEVTARAGLPAPVQSDPNATAYLLFTSGSTGRPKGVPVSHRNADHFLTVNAERYGFTPDDRFTQTFDQTFDLAMFDLFMAWGCGGCLVPLEPLDLLAPFRFVEENRITVWFSVPSVAALLRRKRLLTPGSLRSLRWSLFCGEALPSATAREWQAAAPNSIVENLYGPTEATIACTVHRWDPQTSPVDCVNGAVPIGRPYPGLEALVLTEDRRIAEPHHEGELCVSGPQVFDGYWQDQPQSAEKLIVVEQPAGTPRTWYRTGDRVRRLESGEYVCLGRMDQQVKIHGHRVELGEIEARLAALPGVVNAAVVTVPGAVEDTVELVAFVCGHDPRAEELEAALRTRLPRYMVPRSIHVVDALPLNANQKVDRNALRSHADRLLVPAPSKR
ncbi:amino acid adenylation domain-containing protein [Kitasatospora sp. NPDC058190]|uniref:amino acid adenylation domain-containing protein n=1 Tax=Kitasatospora sp. NPDC058190 TaxID=3346371 RepID=UPI0036D8CFCA